MPARGEKTPSIYAPVSNEPESVPQIRLKPCVCFLTRPLLSWGVGVELMPSALTMERGPTKRTADQYGGLDPTGAIR